MNTQMKAHQAHLSAKAETSTNQSNEAFWKKAEFNRFGTIPILLLLVGCIGGFAASYGAGESTIRLAMVAFPSIIALALMLAGAPMRLVFWSSGIAIILDLFLLIF
jgi:hypothetical protein